MMLEDGDGIRIESIFPPIPGRVKLRNTYRLWPVSPMRLPAIEGGSARSSSLCCLVTRQGILGRMFSFLISTLYLLEGSLAGYKTSRGMTFGAMRLFLNNWIISAEQWNVGETQSTCLILFFLLFLILKYLTDC